MVNKKIFILSLVLSLTSCYNYYNTKKDKNGEQIIDLNSYTFNKKMSLENSKIIDTTSLYLEIPSENYSEQIKENPSIILFHNDGFYEIRSKKYFFTYVSQRTKSSVFYGGKFLLENNNLTIESFYPSEGAKTNYYVREISNGIVKDDTLSIVLFGRKQIFVKRKYSDIFKK